MTSGKFNEFSSQSVACYPLRPVGPYCPVIGADYGSARNRGEFGQGKWQRVGVRRLWSKAVDGVLRGHVITVAVEDRLGKFEIGPHITIFSVKRQSRPVGRIQHFRVIGELLINAEANFWDSGAQVDQMPHGSTGRYEGNDGSTERVTHDDDVVAPVDGGAHHFCVGVEAGRRIVARQIHCNHAVARILKKRSQPFPTPCAVPRAVDQCKRRHAVIVATGEPATPGEIRNFQVFPEVPKLWFDWQLPVVSLMH